MTQPSKDMNDKLRAKIEQLLSLYRGYFIGRTVPITDEEVAQIDDEATQKLTALISQTLNDCLPVKKNIPHEFRSPSELAGIEPQLARNAVIDEIKANLINKLGKK